MVTRVTILGSTGSIGTQALDVIRRGGAARFLVRGLSCGKNDALLARQIAEFGPAAVAVADEAGAARIREAFPRLTVFGGADAAERLAGFCGADVVLNALVGISGLRPTMAAIARLAEERAAGCRPYNSEKRATEGGRPYGYPATSRRTSLALANKESLVAGGRLVTEAAARAGVAIVPVDSEHSAIFQCLQASTGGAGVERLILTASGGPFRGRTRAALTHVTAADALKHPNWDMGSKVTIDSATLFNKGLEVIEARWLFGLPAERIEVLVHPQSIVHSMVAYRDGAVLAQLGVPDMKVP
ncbi:MAG: 1-deoxy-D-xylulose-5-phosphate reductoisomerase, partial [Clostridiales Family XIII bacterium]|nr:1-deoxy-D-xylulose-5-phosphate reductoisomerase [Clostridiales Family XIII bacterium]